jgi:hypothetical protein
MRQLCWQPLAAAVAVWVLSFASTVSAAADEIESLRLAAYQLAGAQLSSGLLDFDINFIAGEGAGSGKTDLERTAFIARQASAAYALAKYLKWSKDGGVSGTVQRQITAFGSLSRPVSKLAIQQIIESVRLLSTPIGRYELRAILDFLGLLYRPTGNGGLLAYEGGYATAWTGSTALAIATELEYFGATGDNRFAELRWSWLQGLQTLHVPGRGFREYPASIEEAAYVDGETWLALATYEALFPADETVKAIIDQYDDYLLGKYSGEPNPQFYSWGTMAAARRLTTTSDSKFADFIAEQASHFVDLELPAADQRENTCALVEGLAAAAAVLAKHAEHLTLFGKLMARINREMTKNQALQISKGAVQLDYQDGAFFRSPRLARYAGAYMSGGGDLYARIDITAHCLSALLEMQGIAARR